jgi:hypothetical protein
VAYPTCNIAGDEGQRCVHCEMREKEKERKRERERESERERE